VYIGSDQKRVNEKIKRNQEHLQSLGLFDMVQDIKKNHARCTTKKKTDKVSTNQTTSSAPYWMATKILHCLPLQYFSA